MLAGMQGIERLIGLYEIGGPIIAVLLVMSIVAMTIVIAKIGQFVIMRSYRLAEARAAVAAFIAGDPEQAATWAASARTPASLLAQRAIDGLIHTPDSEARLREEIARLGNDRLRGLRRGLRLLELIAALAPLLGLLGTVLGMIEAFQALERSGATSDPGALSAGIWQALSTTALGLAVAIPATAAASLLDAHVQRVGEEMDSLMTALFTERPRPVPAGDAG